MPKKRPKTTTKLLQQPQGEVKALMDRLTKIQTLNQKLTDFLSPTIGAHCRVVNIRKSTLVIAVDSPAWINKLRFQLPDLLSFFRNNGFISLANIDLVIQPS